MAADAGRPLKAAQSAAATGLSTDRAKVEALRSKLKRLAGRGWLAEEPGGLFTLPSCEVAGETLKRDGKGFFFLGSEVLAITNLDRKKNPHGSVRHGSRR